MLLLIIGAVVSSCMKHNAIYRSVSIFFPIIIISILFLFFADTPYYDIEKVYPIWGNGLFTTFVSGLCNMFAFQAIAYIYFMPPLLKDSKQIKKISINAIVSESLNLFFICCFLLYIFINKSCNDTFHV